jgi:hypothetical protein
MLRRDENKTTESMKNLQIQLNRNTFLIFGTHTTFHDYNILSSNIPQYLTPTKFKF